MLLYARLQSQKFCSCDSPVITRASQNKTSFLINVRFSILSFNIFKQLEKSSGAIDITVWRCKKPRLVRRLLRREEKVKW